MRFLPSLRQRLLLLTLLTAGLTLVAAGLGLSALFREQVRQQFVERLSADLDQLLARLEVDAQGQPSVDERQLSDPRWSRPQSGLYWQVDGTGSPGRASLLRSRSLWDEELEAPLDRPRPGELHVHELLTERGERLLLIERWLQAHAAAQPWRVMVAADMRSLEQAVQRFDAALVWSLLLLLVLLLGGALLQITLGLSPLGRLRQALAALREGQTARLEGGRYPDEVQPLVEDLNGVLERQAWLLERARAQAGNLAHALKTPLTVLAQGGAAARQSPEALQELPALVQDQVQLARRHIDWHLARSRAAAAAAVQGAAGLRAPLAPVLDGLLRLMGKVHADKGLSLEHELAPTLAFAGEVQDLQEMLGNLLDNACKAAGRRVMVQAAALPGRRLRLSVDDDGPGIPPAHRAAALQRGRRLDESGPGSGLGLAIVQELAELYGGELTLSESPLGGLHAQLILPAV